MTNNNVILDRNISILMRNMVYSIGIFGKVFNESNPSYC